MPPGPQDWWFARHNTECGGRYIKVLEPPEYNHLKAVGNDALRKIRNYLASIDSKTNESLADMPPLTKGSPGIKPVQSA